LQHVLPTGFQKVRHFGFMHKRSTFGRDWLAMLVTVTLNMVYVPIVTPSVMRVRDRRQMAATTSRSKTQGGLCYHP